MNGILTWNSTPCFSLQYVLSLGYTNCMSTFLSISMSVKVELVKTRTTFVLSRGSPHSSPCRGKLKHFGTQYNMLNVSTASFTHKDI